MKLRPITILIPVLLLVLGVAACGGNLNSALRTSQPLAPEDTQLGPDEPNAVVSWSEAASRTGQVITVEGPVIATRKAKTTTGPSTLLFIGAGGSDPGHFVAIIPDSLQAKFRPSPAQHFAGRLVRVKGKIVDYKGSPSITVTGPHKIRIVQ
jgi:hypothetical protein